MGTGANHLTRAIKKEIMNVRTRKIRPRYSFFSIHMLFDVEMDDMLTRKARLVFDGHERILQQRCHTQV